MIKKKPRMKINLAAISLYKAIVMNRDEWFDVVWCKAISNWRRSPRKKRRNRGERTVEPDELEDCYNNCGEVAADGDGNDSGVDDLALCMFMKTWECLMDVN